MIITHAQIYALLPHRSPEDRIDHAEETDGKIFSYHLVTEEDCEGYFPDDPVYPAHKQAEFALQAFCLSAVHGKGLAEGGYKVRAKGFTMELTLEVKPGEILRAVPLNMEIGRYQGTGDVELYVVESYSSASGKLAARVSGIRGFFTPKNRQVGKSSG